MPEVEAPASPLASSFVFLAEGGLFLVNFPVFLLRPLSFFAPLFFSAALAAVADLAAAGWLCLCRSFPVVVVAILAMARGPKSSSSLH
jgi:hypothetical protein